MTSASRRGEVTPPLLVLLALLLPAIPAFAGDLPRVTVRRVDIVEDLRNYHFDKLNSQLTSLEQQAESDPRTEMNAINAFNAFSTRQGLAASRIDDWVRASPDSYPAAVARANARLAMAWAWYLNGNSPEDGQKQAEWAAKSALESERALKINPDGIFAYALRIQAARVGRNRSDFERFKSQALARQPQSFAVREQIMLGILPKWGGSSQAIKDFAASSQQYADKNPAMRFLNAWPLLDAGDALFSYRDYEGAIALYMGALDAGGEYWRTYYKLSEAHLQMGQMEQASRDALRANKLFPDDMPVIAVLAWSTAGSNKPEAAILWASEYLRFFEQNPHMFRLVDAESKELKAQGKSGW